jgi:hypothetical protein
MPYFLKKQLVCVPNTKALWVRNESDILVVSKDMIVTEVEVKRTHSDFLADFKKKQKHDRLKRGSSPVNKFLYACPEGLIQPEEVPSYAGLIWITNDTPRVIKTSPKIHSRPITASAYHRMMRSLSWRFAQ